LIQAVQRPQPGCVLSTQARIARDGEVDGIARHQPDQQEHGEGQDRHGERDLDEARRLISAYAGLLDGCAGNLGPHAGPMKDGLRSLQLAFREASAIPDEPGSGPGEKYTGPVG
jgi:hypothetical protein